MIAVGIDLGGTKVEAQLFDADWATVAQRRVVTPDSYDKLLTVLCDLVRWADDQADGPLPVGLGAAGLVNPSTGVVTAANLPSHGHCFGADFSHQLGRPVTHLNDAAAFTLSEAQFGPGRGAGRLLGLVIGTGVSGAVAANGELRRGATGALGEFGHTAAPAHLVAARGLPLVTCGCGQIGCIETLISGPGLTRLAKALVGSALTSEEVVARRASDPAVWQIWCALVADLIRTLTRTVDPDVIVLGGGLSRVPGVANDLRVAAEAVVFPGFPVPEIRIASDAANSGARGAAFAAWKAAL